MENNDKEIQNSLSDDEVNERIKNHQDNRTKSSKGKSVGRILFENFVNPFNIALFLIAGIFLFFVVYLYQTGNSAAADQYFGVSKFAFLIPVFINSSVSTIQEIHAQRILSKLRIVNEAKACVIRNKEEKIIPVSNLVLDDIVIMRSGLQAGADILVLNGNAQVDESLLTGESTPVLKKKGDLIYSGSFVIAGKIIGKVTQVGDNTYASTLSQKVKSITHQKSILVNDIYKIIRYLSILLVIVIATVIITLCSKISLYGDNPSFWSNESESITYSLSDPITWTRIMITAGTFAVGVIPTGLVLLTTLNFAISLIRLSKNNTMIQELFSLENLSRVDTLCLDKTGTLTDGTLSFYDAIYYGNEEEVKKEIMNILGASDDYNATSIALKEKFGINENIAFDKYLPFSSETKSSTLIYSSCDRTILGAPDYLLDKDSPEFQEYEKKASDGYRVLALKKNDKLIALFLLKDNIRQSAPETISYFYENHIDIRIISGDSPLTVSKIAMQCGVKNSDKAISLENVPLENIDSLIDEYIVFARVSPEQKKAIVEALQKRGHKVAMTGDGVNDILALRKANASITFSKSTDAAKSCSDVILMDNDFTHLKEVVSQGRRIVNNIQKTSILFLMKTFSIALLAFLLIPFQRGQMWYSIENIYLMQTSVIAIGGFMLSIENTKEPIKGNFMRTVLSKALLSAILIVIAVLLPISLYEIPKAFNQTPLLSSNNVCSLISVLTSIAGLVVMISMCVPFTHHRKISVFVVLISMFVLGFSLPTTFIGGKVSSFSMFKHTDVNVFSSQFFKEFFRPWNSPSVQSLFTTPLTYIILGCFFVIALPLFLFFNHKINKYLKRYDS